MKKKLILLIFIYIYSYFPVFAVELRHSIGGEISFYGYTFFKDDPFSLPSGLGLFYSIGKNRESSLFLGSKIYWYGFVPSGTYYNESIMIIPSLSLGYNFILNSEQHSEFSILPYFSVGQYFRSVTSIDSSVWFSRPVVSGGMDFILNTEINTTSAIGIFISAILDNSAIIMPGFCVKTGYSSGSGR